MIGNAILQIGMAGGIRAAAGLNIAGFNSGIALGSLLGGGVIGTFGLTATAIVGAGAAVIDIAVLMFQPDGKNG